MKELGKTPYWTPAGIVMDEPPPAYAALWNDETVTDWERLMSKHGYQRWKHQEDGHLVVEHDIASGDQDITFFVRADDVVAWSLDGYLKLVQAHAQAEQAEALSKLSKSITAFVRHGRGEDTIDEYGDRSKDDERNMARLEAIKQSRINSI